MDAMSIINGNCPFSERNKNNSVLLWNDVSPFPCCCHRWSLYFCLHWTFRTRKSSEQIAINNKIKIVTKKNHWILLTCLFYDCIILRAPVLQPQTAFVQHTHTLAEFNRIWTNQFINFNLINDVKLQGGFYHLTLFCNSRWKKTPKLHTDARWGTGFVIISKCRRIKMYYCTL